ncbi:MAG: glycosyltransferase [Pedobacter sp.]|nr:MAG: glycosyltransferase [Pedobacter sp.]
MNNVKFSVLMAVYINDSAEFLNDAIVSIYENQSLKPAEIVIVKDGPVNNEILSILSKFNSHYPNIFKIIDLPINLGLGEALNLGLKECNYEIVARMDSDDISTPDRFELQIAFLSKNHSIDVVGSSVEEFNSQPGDLAQFRVLPQGGDKLARYSKLRSPLNHPTIVFRKSSVLKAGGYNGKIRLFEDYSLFIRMLANGSKFYNFDKSLLHFRIGDGINSIKRRSGSKYLHSEIKYLKLAYRIKHLSKFEVAYYILIKFPLRFMPTKLTIFFYKNVLRSK